MLEVIGGEVQYIKVMPEPEEKHFLEEINYNLNNDGKASKGELKIPFRIQIPETDNSQGLYPVYQELKRQTHIYVETKSR